jgi:hypothetical protein
MHFLIPKRITFTCHRHAQLCTCPRLGRRGRKDGVQGWLSRGSRAYGGSNSLRRAHQIENLGEATSQVCFWSFFDFTGHLLQMANYSFSKHRKPLYVLFPANQRRYLKGARAESGKTGE